MIDFTILGNIGIIIFLLSFIFVLVSTYFDFSKKRKKAKKQFISFIMPSYNDADSLEESIKGIFQSCDRKYFELIVVNDCSKDNTLKVLNNLNKKYPFKIISNAKNLGKAKSINNAFRFAKGKIIFMVDSDTIINKRAISDILERMEEKHVGGVSCRYIPLNKGFLSAMQRVEYGMLNLIQRSYNFFSTISFWGGCMAVRREVFEKVGMLSENCIIEDGDLALKIGEAGFKAQESSVPVYSYVPGNFSSWYNQKIRWAAGGMQNILNHFSYFLRHPIAIFFFVSYTLLAISFVASLINNLAMIQNFYQLFESFREAGYSFETSFGFAKLASGFEIIKILGIYLLYPLFSAPYILVNYNVKEKPLALMLIFPFSIIYIPLHAAVSIIGLIKGAKKVFSKNKKERGW